MGSPLQHINFILGFTSNLFFLESICIIYLYVAKLNIGLKTFYKYVLFFGCLLGKKGKEVIKDILILFYKLLVSLCTLSINQRNKCMGGWVKGSVLSVGSEGRPGTARETPFQMEISVTCKCPLTKANLYLVFKFRILSISEPVSLRVLVITAISLSVIIIYLLYYLLFCNVHLDFVWSLTSPAFRAPCVLCQGLV